MLLSNYKCLEYSPTAVLDSKSNVTAQCQGAHHLLRVMPAHLACWQVAAMRQKCQDFSPNVTNTLVAVTNIGVCQQQHHHYSNLSHSLSNAACATAATRKGSSKKSKNNNDHRNINSPGVSMSSGAKNTTLDQGDSQYVCQPQQGQDRPLDDTALAAITRKLEEARLELTCSRADLIDISLAKEAKWPRQRGPSSLSRLRQGNVLACVTPDTQQLQPSCLNPGGKKKKAVQHGTYFDSSDEEQATKRQQCGTRRSGQAAPSIGQEDMSQGEEASAAAGSKADSDSVKETANGCEVDTFPSNAVQSSSSLWDDKEIKKEKETQRQESKRSNDSKEGKQTEKAQPLQATSCSMTMPMHKNASCPNMKMKLDAERSTLSAQAELARATLAAFQTHSAAASPPVPKQAPKAARQRSNTCPDTLEENAKPAQKARKELEHNSQSCPDALLEIAVPLTHLTFNSFPSCNSQKRSLIPEASNSTPNLPNRSRLRRGSLGKPFAQSSEHVDVRALSNSMPNLSNRSRLRRGSLGKQLEESSEHVDVRVSSQRLPARRLECVEERPRRYVVQMKEGYLHVKKVSRWKFDSLQRLLVKLDMKEGESVDTQPTANPFLKLRVENITVVRTKEQRCMELECQATPDAAAQSYLLLAEIQEERDHWYNVLASCESVPSHLGDSSRRASLRPSSSIEADSEQEENSKNEENSKAEMPEEIEATSPTPEKEKDHLASSSSWCTKNGKASRFVLPAICTEAPKHFPKSRLILPSAGEMGMSPLVGNSRCRGAAGGTPSSRCNALMPTHGRQSSPGQESQEGYDWPGDTPITPNRSVPPSMSSLASSISTSGTPSNAAFPTAATTPYSCPLRPRRVDRRLQYSVDSSKDAIVAEAYRPIEPSPYYKECDFVTPCETPVLVPRSGSTALRNIQGKLKERSLNSYKPAHSRSGSLENAHFTVKNVEPHNTAPEPSPYYKECDFVTPCETPVRNIKGRARVGNIHATVTDLDNTAPEPSPYRNECDFVTPCETPVVSVPPKRNASMQSSYSRLQTHAHRGSSFAKSQLEQSQCNFARHNTLEITPSHSRSASGQFLYSTKPAHSRQASFSNSPLPELQPSPTLQAFPAASAFGVL
eukprot:g28270.t1